MLEDLQLKDAWTVIATRPRRAFVNRLTWQEQPDPPQTIETAHRLHDRKVITMDNRHTEETVELVVKAKTTEPEAETHGG
jgi:hypothetical protein